MLCNAKQMKEIGEKQVKTIECYVTDKGVKPETLGVIQMLHNTHRGRGGSQWIFASYIYIFIGFNLNKKCSLIYAL